MSQVDSNFTTNLFLIISLGNSTWNICWQHLTTDIGLSFVQTNFIKNLFTVKWRECMSLFDRLQTSRLHIQGCTSISLCRQCGQDLIRGHNEVTRVTWGQDKSRDQSMSVKVQSGHADRIRAMLLRDVIVTMATVVGYPWRHRVIYDVTIRGVVGRLKVDTVDWGAWGCAEVLLGGLLACWLSQALGWRYGCVHGGSRGRQATWSKETA